MSITTKDTDGDGRVETATIVFSAAMNDDSFSPADFMIGGLPATDIKTGNPNDNIFDVVNGDGGVAGTEAKDVTYSGTGKDLEGNSLGNIDSGFVDEIDGANPIAEVSYDITAPTNHDVVATITPSEQVTGDLTHPFTDNSQFTFEFFDVSGNSGEVLAVVTNIDKVAPVISEIKPVQSPTNDRMPDITINVENGVSWDIKNGAVVLMSGVGTDDEQTLSLPELTDGAYDLSLVATDLAGNTNELHLTEFTIDATPPVITIDPYTLNPTNQNITVRALINEGTLNEISHLFTANGTFDFVATDDLGNISTQTVTITNIDKVAPVITLLGDATMSLTVGDTFTDSGAIATDNFDAMVVVNVAGAINTAVGGTYIITYTATDSAGNSATVTRTVNVTVPTPTQTQVIIVPPGGGGGGGGGFVPPSTPPVVPPAPPAIPQVLGAATFNFASDLGMGMSGNAVTELQKKLTSENVYSGPVTGWFGPLTMAGVKNYQAKYGIRQTGFIGSLTRAKLNNSQVVGVSTNANAEMLKAQIAGLQAQLVKLLEQLNVILQAKAASGAR